MRVTPGKGIAALSALLALSGTTFAFPPEGKYRQELRNPVRGQTFDLVKTLHLRLGGKAEMFFEYRGDKPVLDLWMVDEFGGLLEVLRDFRKLKHSGTWRNINGRVLVELTRIESGDQQANLHSAIEFELFSNELVARKQDTGDYGDQTLRLRLLERYDVAPISSPGPGPNPVPIPIPGQGSPPPISFDPSLRKGAYAWADEVAGANGPSILVRRLKLNGDKSAEMVSEYLGERPRMENGSTNLYGVLFAEVVARRKVSHRGTWREADGRVQVELTRVDSGDFAQNIHSAFVFDVQGRDLAVREQDSGDYGTRGSPFRKDWNPAAPPRPGDDPRPNDLPKLARTTELDFEAEGNGTASHSGSRAQALSRMRVILRKDGRYEVRLRGSDDLVFRGRYDMKDESRITLDISDGFGRSASGAGHLSLGRGNRVREITLRGYAGERRFTVTFTAHGG